MTRSLEEFIEHRVGALGYVLLTRRDDVVITELAGQPELDLLARPTGQSELQMRFFGVILKGTEKLLDEESASRELNARFRTIEKGRGSVQYPFPVLALILSMENDQGFFDWRSEPLTARASSPSVNPTDLPRSAQLRLKTALAPSLRLNRILRCKSFTKRSLDDVVRSINVWYDALFESLSSNSK